MLLGDLHALETFLVEKTDKSSKMCLLFGRRFSIPFRMPEGFWISVHSSSHTKLSTTGQKFGEVRPGLL